MKKISIIASSIALLAFVAVPALSSAQTTAAAALSVGASASASNGGNSGSVVNVNVSAQAGINNRITLANKELQRRVTALTALNTRVQGMQRVDATVKGNISTEVQNEIGSMNALQTTVDGETTIAGIRADIMTMTQDYRIFLLVVPQGYILAAADRVQTIVSDMNTVGTKIQARITAAQGAGNNASAALATMADFNAKTADASAQATAAINLVTPLKPDQGDKTVAAANHTALVQARADIKAAAQDLQAARKDAATLLLDLKGFKVSASASGSATVSSTNQ